MDSTSSPTSRCSNTKLSKYSVEHRLLFHSHWIVIPQDSSILKVLGLSIGRSVMRWSPLARFIPGGEGWLAEKGRIYRADLKSRFAFDSTNVKLSLVECLVSKWIRRSEPRSLPLVFEANSTQKKKKRVFLVKEITKFHVTGNLAIIILGWIKPRLSSMNAIKWGCVVGLINALRIQFTSSLLTWVLIGFTSYQAHCCRPVTAPPCKNCSPFTHTNNCYIVMFSAISTTTDHSNQQLDTVMNRILHIHEPWLSLVRGFMWRGSRTRFPGSRCNLLSAWIGKWRLKIHPRCDSCGLHFSYRRGYWCSILSRMVHNSMCNCIHDAKLSSLCKCADGNYFNIRVFRSMILTRWTQYLIDFTYYFISFIEKTPPAKLDFIP
ncbi:hypothetical protein VP01_1702g1 [Puccinia sorghi]|uniref:Uncharacterized protein n=1 Tax=Puccinia sorghi TaxID=27349 RepID=A0A0L6VFP4_9BASI|nr:hypothetical protein VP01_1702g1 [Puccinia sorghi]